MSPEQPIEIPAEHRARVNAGLYPMQNFWRVGRNVGRTIYAQIGSEPSDNDPLIGVMDTRALAERAVAAHNSGLLPGSRSLTPYLEHTPRSLPDSIVNLIDTERQRQATIFQDQQAPARESTARRVFELSRLLRQAINGSVR